MLSHGIEQHFGGSEIQIGLLGHRAPHWLVNTWKGQQRVAREAALHVLPAVPMRNFLSSSTLPEEEFVAWPRADYTLPAIEENGCSETGRLRRIIGATVEGIGKGLAIAVPFSAGMAGASQAAEIATPPPAPPEHVFHLDQPLLSQRNTLDILRERSLQQPLSATEIMSLGKTGETGLHGVIFQDNKNDVSEVIFQTGSAQLVATAAVQTEQDTTISGPAVVLDTDPDRDSGKLPGEDIYIFDQSTGKPKMLELSEAIHQSLGDVDGQRLNVSGTSIGDKIQVKSITKVLTLRDSPPLPPASAQPTPTFWNAFGCQLASNPVRPVSTTFFKQLFTPNRPSLTHFFKEMGVDVSGTGLDWYPIASKLHYALGNTSNDGRYDINQALADCFTAARPDLHLPDSSAGIAFALNEDLSGGLSYAGSWMFMVDEKPIIVPMIVLTPGAATHLYMYAHELGHRILHLGHTVGPDGSPWGDQESLMAYGAWSICPPPDELMGCLPTHAIGFQKYQSGLLPKEDILTVPSGTAMTLVVRPSNRSGNNGGYKVVNIIKAYAPRDFFSVHVRDTVGFYDGHLPIPFQVDDTISPFLWGRKDADRRALVIHDVVGKDYIHEPRLQIQPSCEGIQCGMWMVGQEFSDSKSGVRIRVNQLTQDGLRIAIINGIGTPQPSPTPTRDLR